HAGQVAGGNFLVKLLESALHTLRAAHGGCRVSHTIACSCRGYIETGSIEPYAVGVVIDGGGREHHSGVFDQLGEGTVDASACGKDIGVRVVHIATVGASHLKRATVERGCTGHFQLAAQADCERTCGSVRIVASDRDILPLHKYLAGVGKIASDTDHPDIQEVVCKTA